MDAFIVIQDEENIEGGAVKYLGDLTQWKEVFRTGVYIVLSAVADTLFIYRLWIVWSRNNWVVIAPILLLLGSITSGIGIEVEIATLKGSGLFAKSIAAFATSFFSIGLVQNLLTTSLIVWRIWRVNMGVGARAMGQSSLWPVIAIVLESGALYSANMAALLFTYAAGSYAQYICLDILVPNIGCTFTLIIVRVGLGLTKNASNGRHQEGSGYATQPRIPMSKINISVARTVDIDQDQDLERGADSDMGDEAFDKVVPDHYGKTGSAAAF